MQQKFEVTGMTCSACSAHVEKSVRQLEGVEDVNVNLLANAMQVTYEENKVTPEVICQAVVQAGYNAQLSGVKKKRQAVDKENRIDEEVEQMKFRLRISIVFLIPLMYISMHHMMNLPIPTFLHGTENSIAFAFTQFLLVLPIAYVNRKYYKIGFKTLLNGAPTMDTLIAIGSSAAIVYGVMAIYLIGYGLGHEEIGLVERYGMDLYFESAAMILTLITVGKFLETKSKRRTSEAVNRLLDLAPKKAIVFRAGKEVEVPVEEVVVDDIVLVKPGQSIPVDGVVIEGHSFVDESMLTGESISNEKRKDQKVSAATMNQQGALTIRTTKVGSDTTLAQIVQLVEDASATKAPIAKLADKVSGIFVPVVLGIACIAVITWLLLGYSVEFALSIGIAILVISCPCALGLATPVAIMVGTGKGAECGILIKSAESLENLHHVDTVVLDKTGTITEGRPEVIDVVCNCGVEEQELLEAAYALEQKSEHPLAKAIRGFCSTNHVKQIAVEDFQAVLGQGVQAKINGRLFFGGNAAYMQEKGIELVEFTANAEKMMILGKTLLYFANEEKLLGMISVADTVKYTSKAAINRLKVNDIDVIMLTGDSEQTAQSIQKQLNIPRIIAEVMPQDKERMIRELQATGKKVAMVGDGINDAPALARADVGIAIGAGTDIAIDSADIVLMRDDLMDVMNAIDLSKSVVRNIKMNLFWAFFYNAIGIPLAAGVFYTMFGWKLNPMFGAAAMSLSSVCVVMNALRLKMFEPYRISKSGIKTKKIEKIKLEGKVATMEKVIKIDGMMCNHCKKNVEKILGELDGVSAVEVDLDAKIATVALTKEIHDEIFIKTIEAADYKVIAIQ